MARSLVVVESSAKAKTAHRGKKAKVAPKDGEPAAPPIERVLFHER